MTSDGNAVNYTAISTLAVNAGSGADSVTVNALANGVTTTVDGGTSASDVDTLTFTGSTGNDVITATDTTITLAPNSVGYANFESRTINAGNGDDTIDASTSTVAWTLNGEGGDDTISGGTAADTIDGGAQTTQDIALAKGTTGADSFSLTSAGVFLGAPTRSPTSSRTPPRVGMGTTRSRRRGTCRRSPSTVATAPTASRSTAAAAPTPWQWPPGP